MSISSISETRYQNMTYKRSGKSGLKLPLISMGGWQNFTNEEAVKAMLFEAFNLGITCFDMANNYGPPPGLAEEMTGNVMSKHLKAYRDEIILTSKAGYDMWAGPYGSGGSKKYLIASLDQSLKRLKTDYVDIFYSHRFDRETPLEETMEALETAVRQGKALYAGVSNYNAEQTLQASEILRSRGVPLIINQSKFSMLNRSIDKQGLLQAAEQSGIGITTFSSLEQGLLTDKYLHGIPEGSRAAAGINNLAGMLEPKLLQKLKALNEVASGRGQSLAQMALSWVLSHSAVTSVIIGASRPEQIRDCVKSLDALEFTKDELDRIEELLA